MNYDNEKYAGGHPDILSDSIRYSCISGKTPDLDDSLCSFHDLRFRIQQDLLRLHLSHQHPDEACEVDQEETPSEKS